MSRAQVSGANPERLEEQVFRILVAARHPVGLADLAVALGCVHVLRAQHLLADVETLFEVTQRLVKPSLAAKADTVIGEHRGSLAVPPAEVWLGRVERLQEKLLGGFVVMELGGSNPPSGEP